MTQPNITVTQLDGALGVLPPGAGRLLAVVGTSSSGTAATPATFARVSDVVTTFGAGPLVEDAAYHIQRTGRPVMCVRAAEATAGGYGTPVDGVAGTSAVTVDTGDEPHDMYEFVFEVVTGGTIGTAGITYRYSLDEGTNWSAITALGTANTITTAVGNVGLNFAAGTLVAGDTFSVRTSAPLYDGTTLLAALTALGQSQIPWEIVHVGGAVSATFAGVIEAWMAGLSSKSRNRAYVCNVRVPTPGEAAATYSGAMSSAFVGSFTTKHGTLCAGAADIISGVSGRNYIAPVARYVASKTAQVDIHVNIAAIDLGAAPGVRIRDSLGNLKHHDESVNPGLDDLGFCVLRTWDDEPGVFVNRPILFSGPSSDFQLMPHRRVFNTAIDVASVYLRRRLSKELLVDPESGYIAEVDAVEMELAMNALLAGALTNLRKASSATVVVSRVDDILSIKTLSVELRVVPLGYPEAIVLTVGFLNPALATATA